jgi:hypothetical protein
MPPFIIVLLATFNFTYDGLLGLAANFTFAARQPPELAALMYAKMTLRSQGYSGFISNTGSRELIYSCFRK